jgi:hypothetical protein
LSQDWRLDNIGKRGHKTDAGKADKYCRGRRGLKIQNIDLNGIVNLMYQINNAPAMKSASIRSTFEDPDNSP